MEIEDLIIICLLFSTVVLAMGIVKEIKKLIKNKITMKELSIEEKAKRYDELRVTAQELEHDGCFDK